MEIEADATVTHLREEIRAVDAAIVAAVNRRLELVADIRRHKERIGAQFLDRDRERLNLEELQRQNPGPLSAEGLEHVYREILELTKRESA